MILDAAWLARGWLSVYAAASTDEKWFPLYRTVRVEEYLHGLRLSATDSYMILSAWVPERDHEYDPEPGLDEIPEHAATAWDVYQRAGNLLTHLLKLASGEGAKPIDVRVRLDQPLQPDDDDSMSFEGMEAVAVVIDHPDAERVQLVAIEGGYPDWRPLLTKFKAVRTEAIALNHELLARIVKVAKLHGSGVEAPIKWRWGGNGKAGYIEIGTGEPAVMGLIMPVSWDFERDRPRADVDDGDQQTTDET